MAVGGEPVGAGAVEHEAQALVGVGEAGEVAPPEADVVGEGEAAAAE